MVFCVLFNLIILHLFIIVKSFFKIILNVFNASIDNISIVFNYVIVNALFYFLYCKIPVFGTPGTLGTP